MFIFSVNRLEPPYLQVTNFAAEISIDVFIDVREWAPSLLIKSVDQSIQSTEKSVSRRRNRLARPAPALPIGRSGGGLWAPR
jgi:hypothetical protein